MAGSSNSEDGQAVGARLRMLWGAWHAESEIDLPLPAAWKVRRFDVKEVPALSRADIERAFREPIGTPTLRDLARGRRQAIILVDDLTRPTPVHLFIRNILRELKLGGISKDRVRILFGAAAHRPMTPAEQAKKVGADIASEYAIRLHDFMGPDIRKIGWVKGGPVYLNRYFLEADLRICVGSVIPHNETGFGGGSKMVVPGVAGHLTIAHFHGALPARPSGMLEPRPGVLDRRAWSEVVARAVGLDAVVCANVNARRELAGLFVGDLVEAHRAAARRALTIGRTKIPRGLAERAEISIVNAYPLDSDPMQMGKSLHLARKLRLGSTVVIDAASDGVFYHGMGMGSGLDPRRLLSNLPRWISSPERVGTWLRSALPALRSPVLSARLGYFHLNALSYAAFQCNQSGARQRARRWRGSVNRIDPLIFSTRFPAWGARQKYPRGRLFTDWTELVNALAERFPNATVLVFPCAPLQLPELTD